MLEKDIQRQILQYLFYRPDVYCWRNNNNAVYDSKQGIYRKQGGAFYPKGIADIIGITNTGRFIAIEVKSAKGKASKEQLEFLNKIHILGGIAILTNGYDDFVSKFETYFQK